MSTRVCALPSNMPSPIDTHSTEHTLRMLQSTICILMNTCRGVVRRKFIDGFTSHLTQNRSFWRRTSQPISWLSTKETEPNTAKASNTAVKWTKKHEKAKPEQTHKKQKYKHKPTCNLKNCAYHCAQLSYTIQYFHSRLKTYLFHKSYPP